MVLACVLSPSLSLGSFLLWVPSHEFGVEVREVFFLMGVVCGQTVVGLGDSHQQFVKFELRFPSKGVAIAASSRPREMLRTRTSVGSRRGYKGSGGIGYLQCRTTQGIQ